MENINVGDIVYWVQRTKVREIERVGKVIGVVQPECSPNKIIPGFVRETCSLRNFTTYLVRVYGTNAIFWPSSVTHLPETKKHLLESQAPVTTTRSFIDKGDRMKIKQLCKKLGAEFTECADHLNVLTWKKRFIFRVMDNTEFLSNIEEIKLV